MKLNRLETHDRLIHLKKEQALNVAQGASDCMMKNPLSLAFQEHSPYVYVFAHPRTHDDGVTKRMIWQPRLTKPFMQTNSYLFRGQSGTDLLEPCWLLPPKETWNQYKKGNVTEHELVLWSIDQYINNKSFMEEPFKDDLTDDQVKNIYLLVAREMDEEKYVEKTI